MYKITVFGEPQGKGRPRFARTGHAYTPQATRDYEEQVRYVFMISYPKAIPLENAVRVKITANFKMPNSYSMRKRNELLGKYCTKKSDVDNVAKIILDALNRVAYYDDKQIVKLEVIKKYAIEGHVDVEVEEINE